MKPTQTHTPGHVVGLVMNKLEEYGVEMPDLGAKTADEIGDSIPFLVRACNSHADLLAALEQADEFVAQHSEPDYIRGQQLLATIRAAIARATGQL